MEQQSEGGGATDPSTWVNSFLNLATAQKGSDRSTVTKGEGDVTALKKILDEMSNSTNAAGMDAVFKQIFQRGFEAQMPKLLNAANTTGIRPQDSTTQQLLQNDLVARLTGESQMALGKQQQLAAQIADAYAGRTEKPIVTKVTGEGKLSGGGITGLAKKLLGGGSGISGSANIGNAITFGSLGAAKKLFKKF